MRKLLLFIPFALFIILALPIGAQNALPELGEIYRGDVVPEVRIYVSQDTIDWLYEEENLFSDRYFRARVVFNNGTVNDEFENVGFRLRGKTSRYARKKSFRLSFNTFESGRNYYGVEKMNLNGEHNDPSSMRAITCFEIYRRANLPGSRANHVRVYLNDKFYGVYSNMEHYDEEFTNLYFGTKDGNRYKCTFGADLSYLGDNQESYKFLNGQDRVYDVNNQTDSDDYSDLVNFIRVLNTTSDEDFICEMEKVFEINDYLKYLAIDILIGNWDGPLYNKNNFYLYSNPVTGKFHYLPYDLDNTFGIDWLGESWINRNLYQWSHPSEPRPLYDRIMGIPELRDRYSYFLRELTNDVFTNGNLSTFLFSKRSLIESYIQLDSFKTLDYGFSYDDFRESLLQAQGGHVKHGIIPFIDGRRNSARSQVEVEKLNPILDKGGITYINSGQDFSIAVRVQSDVAISSVNLNYRLNGATNWNSIILNKSTESNDFLEYNHNFSNEVTVFPTEGEYKYYFEAVDVEGSNGYYPNCDYFSFNHSVNEYTIVINEFMASNGNVISDEHGDFDDWVELYNYGSQSVSLENLYLSDRINNPSKWKLPDYTMAPDEYLLIWTDGETHQGPFHASFSLSIDGEDLILSAKNDNGDFISIDELTFETQTRNISFGRYPNAVGPWGSMKASPGESNNGLINSNFEYAQFASNFKLYPNPIIDNFTIQTMGSELIESLEIYTMDGKLLENTKYENPLQVISIENLNIPAGNYYIVLNRKFVQKLIRN